MRLIDAEEAIKLLNKWGVLLPSDADEALDMAIEALSADVVSREMYDTVCEEYNKLIHQLSAETSTNTSTNTSTDLISRKEAIEWLGEEPPVWYDGDDEIAERNQWRRDVAIIKELPSARPTGEWIRCKKQNKADLDNGNALYECSNCRHTDLHAETQEVPYCWYCGAKMEVEHEID